VTDPQAAAGRLPPKRVTWAELFFDLVFVFAVTEVSALLHHDHSWAGTGRALVIFVPIYWAWVGTSVLADTRDVDNPVDRLGIFTIGLCSLFMALAAPGVYESRGLLFGASYFAARILLAVLVFRNRGLVLSPVSVALFVSGPLLLLGGFLHGPARVTVWAIAAFSDLATPALTRRWLLRVRFHPEHLPERFGLLLIIALGESIVAIGGPAAAGHDLAAAVVVAVAAAFVLACALWWVYFAFAADAVRHALETSQVRADVVRRVLSYGHLSFIAAIIAVAVGMAEAVAHPGERLHGGVAGLLFGGCALYFATFGYTRWQMFRKWSTTRLGAAGVVLVLLPFAHLATALGGLCALAVVAVGLNVVEHFVVRRASRSRGDQPRAAPAQAAEA
jgi:low temperature requirement protein LtrA